MTEYYELDCTDCQFRTVMIGEFTDVFEEIDAHRSDRNADPTAHIVNVHRRS